MGSGTRPVQTQLLLFFSSCSKGHEQSTNFLTFKEPKNLFQGTNSARLCSLAGRYNNPIPTRFLAPTDCLKIPAQVFTLEMRYFCLCVELNKIVIQKDRKRKVFFVSRHGMKTKSLHPVRWLALNQKYLLNIKTFMN